MELQVVEDIKKIQQVSTCKCIRLHLTSSQAVLRSTEGEAVRLYYQAKYRSSFIPCLDLHRACKKPPSAPSSDVSMNKVGLPASRPTAIFIHLLDIPPIQDRKSVV